MAFLGEALCYLLVYSKSEFQKLNCETVKLWREYYELEQECGGGPDGRVGGRAGRAAAAVQAKIQRKTKLSSVSPVSLRPSLCPFSFA
ncbi:hypothetical protein Esti_000718 [Eimeria stiedai]